jgi:hypothetical protein
MSDEERLEYFMRIFWDYNLPAEEFNAVLAGKKTKIGHYDKYMLFRKLLESYPWFTILKLFSINQIKELLTTEVIEKLRSESLKKHYRFAQQRLQEIV